jgi:hypothetical protein
MPGPTRSAKRLDPELLPDVVVLDLLLPQAPEGMQVLRELRGRDRQWWPSAAWASWSPKRWWQAPHAFLEKHGRDVDDLLEMTRAAYRHEPWSSGWSGRRLRAATSFDWGWAWR